jgi:hypothetical protein
MEQARFDSPSPTKKSRGIQEIRLMWGQTPKIRALTPALEKGPVDLLQKRKASSPTAGRAIRSGSIRNAQRRRWGKRLTRRSRASGKEEQGWRQIFRALAQASARLNNPPTTAGRVVGRVVGRSARTSATIHHCWRSWEGPPGWFIRTPATASSTLSRRDSGSAGTAGREAACGSPETIRHTSPSRGALRGHAGRRR